MATFSDKLRAVLEERGLGHRTLARMIDPDNVESARRAIRKWLSGQHVPTQTSRDLVTDALGLERGDLDPGEEDSLDAVLFRELQVQFTRIEQMLEGRVA